MFVERLSIYETPLAVWRTHLFEFAREHIYDALLLCFVGIYEILLTLTAAGATGTGESPNGRGERHCRGVSMTEVTKDEPSEPNP